MQNINPNEWYRIPGYNGYEYCAGLCLVRSMKSPIKRPGYILKYEENSLCRIWTLTNDADRRERVSNIDIENILRNAEVVTVGTNSINFAGRRHLMREKGYFQTVDLPEVSNEKEYVDFSGLEVKEPEEKKEIVDFSGLFV